MKTCDVCKGDIEPLLDDKGNTVWADGHNAMPILNGRCCDECNNYVLTLRLKQMTMRDELDLGSRFETKVAISSLATSIIESRRESVKSGANDNGK